MTDLLTFTSVSDVCSFLITRHSEVSYLPGGYYLSASVLSITSLTLGGGSLFKYVSILIIHYNCSCLLPGPHCVAHIKLPCKALTLGFVVTWRKIPEHTLTSLKIFFFLKMFFFFRLVSLSVAYSGHV